MMSKVQTIHLFNCDQTYKFDAVEKWLEREKTTQGFSVQQHYFPLSKMAETSEETIPRLNMDLAVFVVHAHESRLSINEEKAGIGYAEIYRALLQKTGDNVIIVIGGDDNYKDEDEENEQFISRWARRKVSSQFNDEYMDGRKSFILSWNKKHKEIHEEALRHFLDPSKRGTKFEYKPKRKPPPRPVTAPADPVQQSRHGSFSPERPSVKEADSHTPETERPSSRSVKVASDPLHQSRHHSSSAAEPSHVRDSYKPEGRLPERRSVSPLQNDGNTQVEVSSSRSGEIQKQLIDLAVFGCNVLENSMQVVKEVLGRLRSQLHISSQIIENYAPVKVRSCLEEKAARICVLLVDAETVTDAYRNLPRRKMEYEDLLKTAVDTVAEKVIIVIFAPCSLPSKKDEVVVKEAIEAILLVTGKGHVQWVKDNPITPEVLEEKIMSSIRSQVFPNSGDSRPTSAVEYRSNVPDRTAYDPLKAHSSQQLYPYGYDRDQNQSQQRMSMQSRGPPSVYRDFSTMKGFVMLKTRLRFGQISKRHGDVQLWYPRFVVASDTKRKLLQEYWNIAEAVVEIASDGNGGLCMKIKLKSEEKEEPVQLSQNETVMLKTRLRDGQISMQQGDLKFLYPQWQIPSYIIQSLSEEYRFHSDVELYIISDEKGHLRTQVKTYRKDRVSSAFKKVFK
ncbi:uncharacterized protein [Montipora capricornis]|uniref:uncharacterized protein n=1 Tax=Montipora capricornis TaxID=246305 RepID=UPI0035F1DFEC